MLLLTTLSLLVAFSAANVLGTKSAAAAATTGNVTVYAYGSGISGLPVLADSNGLAYVSLTAASNLSNVSWAISSSTTVPWTVTFPSTSTNTSTNTTNVSTFYIITTADAYSPVGFVSSNDTAPTGAVEVGFTIYGSDIMYVSDSVLEAQFWAKETVSGQEWEIMWNANGEDQSDSTPVTLKIAGPAV